MRSMVSGRGLLAVGVIAVVAVASGTASAQATANDPFAAAVTAGTALTNFLIWTLRVLGFGGLAWAAFKAYFKKFDFVALASVLGGLLMVAGAPTLIDYLFTTGGLATGASSLTTWGGTAGSGTGTP